jgi:probable F420-dependent oxidoreductase
MVPVMGRVGVWSHEMRFGERDLVDEAAIELEALGYGALWIPGGIDNGVLDDVDRLLSRTSRLAIGTGIINIWKQSASDVANWWKAQSPERQARVWLGVGVSHAPLIGKDWDKPIARMRGWLEDASAAGLPADALCLAALGPQMLAMARERAGGAHPYLVTPEHTAAARALLGPGKQLAPELGVVLECDPDKARSEARKALQRYTLLPNYVNNWKRLGFAEDEISAMSDRLVDALFAWGEPDQIAARVQAHSDAGADHVCLQVITSDGLDGARAAWRSLADLLL